MGNGARAMKVCNLCDASKPLGEFYPDMRRPDGRQSTCKVCERSRRAQWRQTPSGRKCCKGQIYKPRRRFVVLRNRAKAAGLSATLPFERYEMLLREPCHYCNGVIQSSGIGLDRLDSEKGYHASNVVPCCATCNAVKNNVFTEDEMLRLGAVIRDIREQREAAGGSLGHPFMKADVRDAVWAMSK